MLRHADAGHPAADSCYSGPTTKFGTDCGDDCVSHGHRNNGAPNGAMAALGLKSPKKRGRPPNLPNQPASSADASTARSPSRATRPPSGSESKSYLQGTRDRACSTTGSDRGSLRDHDLTLIVRHIRAPRSNRQEEQLQKALLHQDSRKGHCGCYEMKIAHVLAEADF